MSVQKKVASIVMLILSTSLFTGCFSKTYYSVNGVEQKYRSDDSAAKGLIVEVLRCFDEEDSESLKRLFCDETLARPTIDDEIQAAMEFYQGKSISHGLVSSGSGGKTIAGGITRLDAAPYIDGIKTDANGTYRLGCFTNFVYAKDRDREGIVYISITPENGEKCLVGEWLD